MLSQHAASDDRVHPCAFFSHRLSPAERNYDIGNRDLLAVKLALEEWHHWLEGSGVPFIVLTDHKNLEYIRTAKCLNSRQARWAVRSLVCMPSCWNVVFGSRHSCLEFQFRVGGSDSRAPRSVSLWECAVSRSLGRTLFCPRVFCCDARSSCFYRLRAFMLYLVLCGTQLVYFIGCVLSCCHVLCEHVAYEFSH